MAKSVISILVGCAIEDGLIPSVDIPVTQHIPELKGKGFEKVTLEHVLQMTSGLDYKESYTNPFGDAATFYYGRDLRKAIFNMELEVEPGTRFSYQSGNPQILGLVLDRALGDKTISDYMEEKLRMSPGRVAKYANMGAGDSTLGEVESAYSSSALMSKVMYEKSIRKKKKILDDEL